MEELVHFNIFYVAVVMKNRPLKKDKFNGARSCKPRLFATMRGLKLTHSWYLLHVVAVSKLYGVYINMKRQMSPSYCKFLPSNLPSLLLFLCTQLVCF
jgi:hypothetical protein